MKTIIHAALMGSDNCWLDFTEIGCAVLREVPTQRIAAFRSELRDALYEMERDGDIVRCMDLLGTGRPLYCLKSRAAT